MLGPLQPGGRLALGLGAGRGHLCVRSRAALGGLFELAFGLQVHLVGVGLGRCAQRIGVLAGLRQGLLAGGVGLGAYALGFEGGLVAQVLGFEGGLVAQVSASRAAWLRRSSASAVACLRTSSTSNSARERTTAA